MEFLKQLLTNEQLDELKKLLGEKEAEFSDLTKEFKIDMSKGNYIPRDKFNEVNEKLKNANESIEKMKNDFKGNEELTAQIETYKKQVEETEAKYKKREQDLILEKTIASTGVKNVRALKGLIDFEKIAFKDDGTIEGLNDQIEAIKKTDSYLFVPVQQNEYGGSPINKPTENKLSALEQRFYELNPNLKK